MSTLKTTIRTAATGPVIEVTGDLDYDTAPQLRDLLSTLTLHHGQRLVLDLARLEFCDSSGISALIAAHNHAEAARAETILTAVPGDILRILHLTALDQVFTLHPDIPSSTSPPS
ncbi:STAS domain-containing protein [Streptomyces sp. NPDC057217]|uniref:STAS domain-containing protein n=1 Tax=Streptomyces sp. NPDC057217 TaxID=3346054 RepID=UPI0036345BBC